jgi:hypothetical protein
MTAINCALSRKSYAPVSCLTANEKAVEKSREMRTEGVNRRARAEDSEEKQKENDYMGI